MQEALDFLEESTCLAALIETQNEDDLARPTLFKSWTTNDILAHLFMWNEAAALTLKSREAFQDFATPIMGKMLGGASHLDVQRQWLAKTGQPAAGHDLCAAWRASFTALAENYQNADPEIRVAWAGPDMNARAKIIARQMEVWAHGQAAFDLFAETRADTDRIKNIAHLGVTTYSWTFRNRGQTPPSPKPFVNLTAPSGAVWTWNEPQEENMVAGSAVEFAQVAAQTRNIADTKLKTTGETAAGWMAIAQCFAGPPETPPAPGLRTKTT